MDASVCHEPPLPVPGEAGESSQPAAASASATQRQPTSFIRQMYRRRPALARVFPRVSDVRIGRSRHACRLTATCLRFRYPPTLSASQIAGTEKILAFALERGLPCRQEHISISSRRFTQMPIHRSLGGTPSLLVVLALGVTAHVQAQGRVFKSTVEVVPLTVTVTDAKGRYLKNLVETDFAVLEEGVRQPLAFFANEPVPIDLALTIDASASMARLLPIV